MGTHANTHTQNYNSCWSDWIVMQMSLIYWEKLISQNNPMVDDCLCAFEMNATSRKKGHKSNIKMLFIWLVHVSCALMNINHIEDESDSNTLPVLIPFQCLPLWCWLRSESQTNFQCPFITPAAPGSAVIYTSKDCFFLYKKNFVLTHQCEANWEMIPPWALLLPYR